MTVLSPPNGSVINANSVTVRGTVVPSNATVEVAGQAAAVGNGVFPGTRANLQIGKTTIDVIGSAPQKSPGSTSIVITRPGASSVKRHKSASGGADSGIAGAAPGSESNRTSCGGDLSVGPYTSCAFAQNVQAAYEGQGAGTYSIYSLVTGLNYDMTCTEGDGEVTCTIGGDECFRIFPRVSYDHFPDCCRPAIGSQCTSQWLTGAVLGDMVRHRFRPWRRWLVWHHVLVLGCVILCTCADDVYRVFVCAKRRVPPS